MLLVKMVPSIKLKCQEKSIFSCLDHSSLGLTFNIKLLTSFVYGRLKREEIELNKKHVFTCMLQIFITVLRVQGISP